jgi:hypothetical protein
MIVLTMDVDWAPDWAIQDAVQAVRSRGLALTVFVTHDSPAIRELLEDTGVERALHPNYLPGSDHGATPAEALEHVAAICPEAVGVRTHGLWRGTSFVVDYGRRGLQYEASDLLPLHPGLQGGRYWNGVAQLPTWWEDDVHMLYGRPMRLDDLPLDAVPPLAVFDFHPILLALNAATLDGYGRLKARLAAEKRTLRDATRDEVLAFADAGDTGDRVLLDDLCDWCAERPGHGRRTMRQVAAELP